jgi:deoxycytidylate deaminase
MNSTESDYLSSHELDSELIIGLVCAVGTESILIVDLIKERLGRAGYIAKAVKVSSDVIPQLVTVSDCGNDKYKRYSELMDAGNRCRARKDRNGNADDAILALGAATIISTTRRQLNQRSEPQSQLASDESTRQAPNPLPKTAFIIDSLKRPEEVEKLRIIYPSGFILIGIHEEEARRRKHLIEDHGMTEKQAKLLLERDSEESTIEHGQRVNATFHLADFFVHLTNNRDRLRFEVQRIVELWFGNPFITPTPDEHAMFFAFAAALRSADLSRQVGAVITKNAQVLSVGANECPRAGGGLYWPSEELSCLSDSASGIGCALDSENGRDYKREEGDSNRAEQLRIIDRIIDEAKADNPNFDAELLRKVLKKSGIRDLTEFGRVVHAEMEALLCCARNGIPTVNATLYCTTFPCHNCAKHIVAAGISRVVYVEPYPKSKALTHHNDSIITSGDLKPECPESVTFEPFVGVGPRRFFELFSMNLGSSYPLVRKDKETGKRRDWHIESAQLRLQMKPVSYLDLELYACKDFGDKLNLVKGDHSDRTS